MHRIVEVFTKPWVQLSKLDEGIFTGVLMAFLFLGMALHEGWSRLRRRKP